ncbi:hypothetical protein NQ317_005806 [Molorchus minor]|uniref:Proteasome subunit beta type-1 n=1 Tax=Molorchus minor TaxID=1323400 RepID=A0ABQ9J853_9CUCU|nr:hypothetical protein NQ317_005806 [Molorchus minor]
MFEARPHYPDYSTAPVQHQFSPYADNGGSVVAIAGEDFVVIGADTRLSAGFSIYTRNQNKLFQLSKTTVLGCSVGLDNEGKGCVYSYDPIGHCEKAKYRAGGSAGALLQPLLDNQIGQKNMEIASKEPISQEKAIATLKDVFISAAERDIYTGDSVSIKVITKDGIKEETFELRKD